MTVFFIYAAIFFCISTHNSVSLQEILEMFWIFLKDMLQIILSPAKGWEDVSYDGVDERNLVKFGLCPYLIIVALTVLIQMIYHSELLWLSEIQQVFVTFIKFFVSYCIGVFVLLMNLPGHTDADVTEKRVHTFSAYITGLMATLELIQNCIPLEIAWIWLLPLYVSFIVWRGVSYMTVQPGYDVKFVVVASLSLILPPYIIQLLFNFAVS